MQYTVTGFNNFCRVFQLPNQSEYPKGYCFGGPKPVMIGMVDWFNPISPMEVPQWAISEERYNEMVQNNEFESTKGHTKEINSDELQEQLTDFLKQKKYIKPNTQYLVLCNFGFAFTFTSN